MLHKKGLANYNRYSKFRRRHLLAVKSWEHMISRCEYTCDQDYKNYGARGIRVEDPRWFKFENFLEDMGDPPIEVNGQRYTLDRKDHSKGYYKDNCRWATATEQAANRTTYSLYHRIQEEFKKL